MSCRLFHWIRGSMSTSILTKIQALADCISSAPTLLPVLFITIYFLAYLLHWVFSRTDRSKAEYLPSILCFKKPPTWRVIHQNIENCWKWPYTKHYQLLLSVLEQQCLHIILHKFSYIYQINSILFIYFLLSNKRAAPIEGRNSYFFPSDLKFCNLLQNMLLKFHM